MIVADVLDIPRGGLPSLSQLFEPAHATPVILGVAGDLLWIVAYALFIRIGFRQRTYAVPVLAVCLNITWELVYTVIHRPASGVTLGLHLAWLAIDAVILFQVFRYGRDRQRLPGLRRFFPFAVLGALVFAFLGHLTLHDFQVHLALFPDRDGVTAAFAINLVMSVLFVGLLFERSDLRGLSYGAAWAKLLGTALISLGNVLLLLQGTSRSFDLRFRPVGSAEWVDAGTVGGSSYHPGFAIYLFATILVFDVLYVVLLWRARRSVLSATASSV